MKLNVSGGHSMRSLHISSIVALLVTLSTQARAQELVGDEQRLIELVNAARAEAGLGELQPDTQLAAVARSHSSDMAENQFFSHVSPTNGDVTHRLNTAHVRYRNAGENIALDSSVDTAHQAFMNSPAHRANVLNPDFTNIGVGVVRVGDRVMVTEAFTRAHDAGPAGATAAPSPPQTAAASGSDPQAADVAPDAAQPSPEEPTLEEPSALPSPFDLLERIVGTVEEQLPANPQAQAQSRPETAPRAERPADPEPGIWIVSQDGTWHHVDVSSDALLDLLRAL
jgi:hypothetical protein